MKILFTNMFNYVGCVNKKNLQTQLCTISRPSFGDTFERNKTDNVDHLKKIFEIQNNKFAKLLDEINSISPSNDIDCDIDTRNELLARLASIKNEFELINNLLSKSSGENKYIDAQIAYKFLFGRQNMAADKGFNRIAGYEHVVNALKDKFSVNIMLGNRLSTADINDKVPNVIFFYGPTGTGKTTFAKALAEDSLSNIIDLNLSEANCDNERIELIKDALLKSSINYENTKNDGGQRTIILINEADSLIKKANPNFSNYEEQKVVVDKFINLLKDCSEKYKATFFITTNNPLRVDNRILDNKITPFKVPLGPCTKEEAKLILNNKLKYFNVSLDTDKIVEKLFENPQKVYSNSNLTTMIENAVKNDACDEDSILYAIESGKVIPSIQARDIKIFNDARQSFLQ